MYALCGLGLVFKLLECVLGLLFAGLLVLSTGLQACINPATFRDGSRPSGPSKKEVQENAADVLNVMLPNAVTRLRPPEEDEGAARACDSDLVCADCGGTLELDHRRGTTACVECGTSRTGSGETSIPVAIAVNPGRDPMLSRVQELERELAMLRSQRA